MGSGDRHGLKRIVAFVRDLVHSSARDEITILAAAIAHFALLSLVPISLLLASVLGTVLQRSSEAAGVASRLLSEAIPNSALITDITQRLVHDRGPVGGIGLAILVWLSLRTFTVLQRALDTILHIEAHQKPRSLTRRLLVSLGTISVIGLLAYASLLASSLLHVFASWGPLTLAGWPVPTARWINLLRSGVTTLASIAVMLLIYTWLPSARVRLRSALVGAVTAGILWELAKRLFAIYISRYAAVDRFYGAMGGLVLVVAWSYLSALVVLLGAEVVECHARWSPRQGDTMDTADSSSDLETPGAVEEPACT